jgi:hypothetical protein
MKVRVYVNAGEYVTESRISLIPAALARLDATAPDTGFPQCGKSGCRTAT